MWSAIQGFLARVRTVEPIVIITWTKTPILFLPNEVEYYLTFSMLQVTAVSNFNIGIFGMLQVHWSQATYL